MFFLKQLKSKGYKGSRKTTALQKYCMTENGLAPYWDAGHALRESSSTEVILILEVITEH